MRVSLEWSKSQPLIILLREVLVNSEEEAEVVAEESHLKVQIIAGVLGSQVILCRGTRSLLKAGAKEGEAVDEPVDEVCSHAMRW